MSAVKPSVARAPSSVDCPTNATDSGATVDPPAGTRPGPPAKTSGAIARAAVADQTHSAANHLVQERSGVLRHQLDGDRPSHVSGMAVTPTFGQQEPKSIGQTGELAGKVSAVGESAVQQHCRVTFAAIVVPHAYAIDVYVTRHRAPSSVGNTERRTKTYRSANPNSGNSCAASR